MVARTSFKGYSLQLSLIFDPECSWNLENKLLYLRPSAQEQRRNCFLLMKSNTGSQVTLTYRKLWKQARRDAFVNLSSHWQQSDKFCFRFCWAIEGFKKSILQVFRINFVSYFVWILAYLSYQWYVFDNRIKESGQASILTPHSLKKWFDSDVLLMSKH